MTERHRYLRHITLDPSDPQGRFRSTASYASCAEMLRHLLARALAGDEVALSCNPPCTITAAKTVRGRGLVVTLGPSGGSVYVAPTSLSGATLWRSIGSKDVPPPGAPWVASGVDLAEMASLIAAAWMCR